MKFNYSSFELIGKWPTSSQKRKDWPSSEFSYMLGLQHLDMPDFRGRTKIGEEDGIGKEQNGDGDKKGMKKNDEG